MDIEIITKSKYKDTMLKAARFYAKQLNIHKSNYKLLIYTEPKLDLDGAHGSAYKVGNRTAHIEIYSRLPTLVKLMTLAHEMVHIKQFVRGHYKSEPSRNGKFKRYWLGNRVSTVYEKQPWEIEAYKKQQVLFSCLIDTVTKKSKRNKK